MTSKWLFMTEKPLLYPMQREECFVVRIWYKLFGWNGILEASPNQI